MRQKKNRADEGTMNLRRKTDDEVEKAAKAQKQQQ